MAPDFSNITLNPSEMGFDDPANPTSFTATVVNNTENYISFAFAPTFDGQLREEYQSEVEVIDPGSTGEITTSWPESENELKDDITVAVFVAQWWDGSTYNDIPLTDTDIPLQFRAPYTEWSINDCIISPTQVKPGSTFDVEVGVNNDTGASNPAVFHVDVGQQRFVETGTIDPNGDTFITWTYTMPENQTAGYSADVNIELAYLELDQSF